MEDKQLALSAFAEGRYSDAIRHLTNLLEMEQNVTYYCNRATAYYKLELYRKCIQDCDAALKLDSNCLKAYLKKGEALKAVGKIADAEKTFAKGLTLDGDFEILSSLLMYSRGQTPQQQETPVIAPQASYKPTPVARSAPTPSASFNDGPPPLEPDEDQRPPVTFNRQQGVVEAATDADGEQLRISSSSKAQPIDVNDKSIQASIAVAARGLVQHGVGNPDVDQKIALGYLHVNTGNFGPGIKLFSELIAKNPRIVAAFLGRGTAYALSGQLDLAIEDFTSSLKIDPECVDALKRRGQTRAARGYDAEAIDDFSRAVNLQKDHEVYHQRGLVYYKQKNFKRALDDFKEATKFDHSNKLTWNHMGLCFNAIGNCKEAVEAHMKAISLDRTFKEAWANMAQAYKDWGNYEKSEQFFTKSLEFDPNYVHAYHLRAMARFGVGDHYRALDDLNTAVKSDPYHVDSRHMRGVIMHGIGMLKAGIAEYDYCLSRKPEHVAWYQKEIALYWQHHLDTDFYAFNMDRELDPHFKEAWCKRSSPKLLPNYVPQKPVDESIADIEYNEEPVGDAARKLVTFSRWYGKLLHQDSPGYLPNRRQMSFAGLAALEVAQMLRAYLKTGSLTVDGRASSYTDQPHALNWRDMFDITVRWRQISEPNDPVWWVDLLTPEQFAEGFGSHTPIITGQCDVVRYGPMFVPSFPIVKRLIPEQCTVSEAMAKQVEKVQTLKEMYEVMKRDFWVVTPCHSTATPGKIMEGTRLTLQYVPPEGFEYSIRTPGTPPRWIDYDLELAHCFEQFLAEASKPDFDLDTVSDWILTIVFYWYNFMPLSRGTAATGYIALVAMFLSVGIKINRTVPPKVLVDWEGILRPTPRDFIDTVKPWLYAAREKLSLEEFDAMPSMRETFPTLRQAIMAMNTR
jgi:tetratricopeptide (TPR) repeat protein